MNVWRWSIWRLAHPAQLTTGDGLDGQAAFARRNNDRVQLRSYRAVRALRAESHARSGAHGLTEWPQQHSAGRGPRRRFIAYHEAAGGGIWSCRHTVEQRGGSQPRVHVRRGRPMATHRASVACQQSHPHVQSALCGASAIWVVEPETCRTRFRHRRRHTSNIRASRRSGQPTALSSSRLA